MSDPEEIIRECVGVLERIMNDDSVPRNIRRGASDVKKILLKTDDAIAIRAATGINILDELSNDPNIPLHTRTLVWNIVSNLETIPLD